jgi:ASC-1-like (ASCH) protein
MVKSIWETLSAIDCNEHTEKKNGMTYLSWAWAWGILKKHYPTATFTKHLSDDGIPVFLDSDSNGYVKVTVTIGDESMTEVFPVLDFRNKSIKNPDSFAVNTALQRCLTKALSYFGLGHYIYAGEDIPQDAESTSKEEKVEEVKKEVKKVEEKASKPDTLTIDVPDKGTFKKVDTDVDIKKVGEYGEKIIEVYKDIALPQIKTVDDLVSYYRREEATLENLKQNAVDVYDKIKDLFTKRKEELNG